MKSANDQATALLEFRLSAHRTLGPKERDLISHLSWRVEELPARQTFIHDGDKPAHSCLVLAGVVARTQYTAGGQRQILSVHIPGDMPDLQSLHIGRMDHDLETVSATQIAFIPHKDLNHLCAISQTLNATFWRESLIDAALHRAAIFRNAQLDADSRLAHFLCEMHFRHKAVGLVDEEGFSFPLSQELMGEVLGLTIVSINRSSQTLRSLDLIRMQKGHIQVLDVDGLVRFGQFDGTFLHQRFDHETLARAS
ncbi:Crp/Fnr family transcriptional regulator [Aureimonas sp. SK2]|uniref:Crp/Fnr family transcriptional regulator n=1 Tax=Aureimonas sp. SK2 TaxID=3015992 RepID=UPI00244504EE|nr:Crp/Fnr family transcriptional regulator [Aureimonas sp. SK2]